MQIITGEVNENLIVNQDVLLSGTCNGNIYIEKDLKKGYDYRRITLD